jgi:hypothetical protein
MKNKTSENVQFNFLRMKKKLSFSFFLISFISNGFIKIFDRGIRTLTVQPKCQNNAFVLQMSEHLIMSAELFMVKNVKETTKQTMLKIDFKL